VYWNNTANFATSNYFNNSTPPIENDTLSLKSQQAAPAINSWGGKNSGNNEFAGNYRLKAPSARNVMVQSPDAVRTKDQGEYGAGRQQQQSSKLVAAEAEFQQLIGDANEGTMARFINNKLNLLVWYRSPRDPHYIFGAQINLTRIKDELRDWLPG